MDNGPLLGDNMEDCPLRFSTSSSPAEDPRRNLSRKSPLLDEGREALPGWRWSALGVRGAREDDDGPSDNANFVGWEVDPKEELFFESIDPWDASEVARLGISIFEEDGTALRDMDGDTLGDKDVDVLREVDGDAFIDWERFIEELRRSEAISCLTCSLQ